MAVPDGRPFVSKATLQSISEKLSAHVLQSRPPEQGNYFDYDSDSSGDCCCPSCVDFEAPPMEERPVPMNPIHYLKAEDQSGRLCIQFGMELEGYGPVNVIPSGRELVCLQVLDI